MASVVDDCRLPARLATGAIIVHIWGIVHPKRVITKVTVGASDEMKWTAVVAFLILDDGYNESHDWARNSATPSIQNPGAIDDIDDAR